MLLPKLWENNIWKHQKLQKNGRRLWKNLLPFGLGGVDARHMFYSNQRTLGLIAETITGVTVLSWWEWLGQSMSFFFVVVGMNGRNSESIGSKVLLSLSLSLVIKSTRSYTTPWPLKISTICMYSGWLFSSLFINDETLPTTENCMFN